MPDVHTLRIKLFADGADLDVMARMAREPMIHGFTTNPTLMRKAGVTDYRLFAKAAVDVVGSRPISFEVFSDDFDTMEREALEIASWGPHVYVKIPVTNTRAEFAGPVIRRLSRAGVQVNVTAVLTTTQVQRIAECLSEETASFVSIFAGRIADTGRDPVPTIAHAVELLRALPQTQVIWASPRELLNVFQADAAGCHVIAATADLLAKLPLVGKDLAQFSLETVEMFRRDAIAAGYSVEVAPAPHPSPLPVPGRGERGGAVRPEGG